MDPDAVRKMFESYEARRGDCPLTSREPSVDQLSALLLLISSLLPARAPRKALAVLSLSAGRHPRGEGSDT